MRADCRDGEFSVNTYDWPQRVPCLLWRTDRWCQWEEGKWAAALALHCGWRIEACPQLSDNGDDVRGGRRCRWAGSCPSLASGEVVHSCTGHSCGENWQTASQECSWSHPLLPFGNYQTHTHTHSVCSSAGESKRPAHISDPLFHSTVFTAPGWSRVCMLDFHSCQRNTGRLNHSIKQMRQKMREYPTLSSFGYEDSKHINTSCLEGV